MIYLLSICMGSSIKSKQSDVHLMLKRNIDAKINPYKQKRVSLPSCQHHLRGVLDRFEKNVAVILFEDIDQELIIPRDQLPNGSVENTWFSIKYHTNGYKIISIDKEKTKKEKKKSLKLLKKLQKNK